MFEWCFRARYTTAGFGIAVAASTASFAGTLGAGSLSIVVGIAVGMPVLTAGSPNLDGEAYLGATDALGRAVDAAVTAAVAGTSGVAVAVAAREVAGGPVPSLLGAAVAVLAGQAAFFYRNREHLNRQPRDDGAAEGAEEAGAGESESAPGRVE